MTLSQHFSMIIVMLCLLLPLSGCGSDGESEDTTTEQGNVEEDSNANNSDSTENTSGDFQLTSSAFGEGDTLPTDYTCSRDGGGDLSPPLSWSNSPEGVSGYAVVMYHYPQGAVGTPSHYWEIWNIPATVAALESGNPESIGDEGSNKDGVEVGYTPPCSPGDAVHEYTIRVYALSAAPEALGTGDNLSVGWEEFVAAVEPLSLGMAELSFSN